MQQAAGNLRPQGLLIQFLYSLAIAVQQMNSSSWAIDLAYPVALYDTWFDRRSKKVYIFGIKGKK